MTFKLWVDDLREPPDETWAWVRTSEAAIAVLNMPGVSMLTTLISLDYDLGNGDTAMPIAQWIEAMAAEGRQPPKWAIHGPDQVSRRGNLQATLRRADYSYQAHQAQADREYD